MLVGTRGMLSPGHRGTWESSLCFLLPQGAIKSLVCNSELARRLMSACHQRWIKMYWGSSKEKKKSFPFLVLPLPRVGWTSPMAQVVLDRFWGCYSHPKIHLSPICSHPTQCHCPPAAEPTKMWRSWQGCHQPLPGGGGWAQSGCEWGRQWQWCWERCLWGRGALRQILVWL